jgi:anti-sigma factor (TIGR02949 family)
MTRMSCEAAMRQFFAYLDGVLSGESLNALEAHLQDCLDCCDRLQFNRRLDSVVKARLAEGGVPEGVEDRLRRRLAKLGLEVAEP